MNIKGIDVSEHQGKIDWERVKNNGIKFAILRCGYGMDTTSQDDAEFERNANECERLGIPYGVYLFSYANTVEKARSEAKHTLRLVDKRKLSLGVWYDIEDNKTSGSVEKETLTNIINTYCNTIKNEGYDVGIYANVNWLERKIEKSIRENYKVWVAQYYSKCEYEGKYVMWQYTSGGDVSGISGKVDMNYLYEEIEKVEEKPVEKPVEKKAEDTVYVVKSGDTLSKIASKYGTTYQELARINNIENPNLIFPGQKIKINGKGNNEVIYVVRSGDTLSGIASKYGTTYQKIASDNGIKNPNLIYPGQKLVIK